LGLGDSWTDHATLRGSLAAAKVSVPLDFRAFKRHGQGLGVLAVVLLKMPSELRFAAEPQFTTRTLLDVVHLFILLDRLGPSFPQLWSERESQTAWTRADQRSFWPVDSWPRLKPVVITLKEPDRV
jgi:hypothetical protein